MEINLKTELDSNENLLKNELEDLEKKYENLKIQIKTNIIVYQIQ